MGFWEAVASARSYATNLHLAPDRKPHQHLITQIFTGPMLFLMPNQQCAYAKAAIQSTVSHNLLFCNHLDMTSVPSLSQHCRPGLHPPTVPDHCQAGNFQHITVTSCQYP